MIENKLKIEAGGWATLIQFPNGHWCNPAHVKSVTIREMPGCDEKYRPVVVVIASTGNWEFPIYCSEMNEAVILRDELAKYICHGGKPPTPPD